MNTPPPSLPYFDLAWSSYVCLGTNINIPWHRAFQLHGNLAGAILKLSHYLAREGRESVFRYYASDGASRYTQAQFDDLKLGAPISALVLKA